MDTETLAKANSLVGRIKQLQAKKDRINWYLSNERLNSSSIAGFGTHDSSSFNNDSIIDKQIFPVGELLEEYLKRIDIEITSNHNELDLL